MNKRRVFLGSLAILLLASSAVAGCKPVPPSSPVATDVVPTSIIIAASNTTDEKKAQADIVCDGVSDSKTIANAISSLSNGGDVLLMAGTYNLEQRLLVNEVRNITLRGEGASTILRQNNAIKTRLSLPANAGQNTVTVTDAGGLVAGQDIYIGSTDGTRQTQDTSRAPYWEAQRMVGPSGESNIITAINGNTLSLFHNLTNSYTGIEDLWTIYDATYFRSCHNLKVLNLTLDGNRDNLITTTGDIFMNGLRFSSCNDIEVANCYVRDVYYNHIMAHPGACLRANIHNNVVTTTSVSEDSQTRGIVIEARSNDSIVAENQITGHETGVYIVGSAVTVKNNSCLDNKQYGIFNNRGINCIIEGNTIKNAVKSGIAIQNREVEGEAFFPETNNSFSDNTIISPGQQGIDIVEASYIQVINNRIIGSGQKGIRILGGSYCNLTGNYIQDAGQNKTASFPGIQLAVSPYGSPSTNNTLERNVVKKTLDNDLSYCILLDEESGDNVIKDNDLSGFAIEAVYSGSSHNIISTSNDSDG